jgi:photosystem II stability/assembly factor-like uncharacterized protein
MILKTFYNGLARCLAGAILLALLAPRILDAQQPRWERVAIGAQPGEVYTGLVRTVNVDSAGTIYMTTPSDTIWVALRPDIRNTLWRSDDNGITWTRLRDDVFGSDIVTPFPGMISAISIQPHPVYVTLWPLEISNDRGATWRVMNPDYYPGTLAWNDSGVVMMTLMQNREYVRDIGVSADSGRTWTKTDRRSQYLPLWGTVTRGGTVIVNGVRSASAMAHERSTDLGHTWDSVASVPMNSVVAAMPNGTVFAHGLGIPGSGPQAKHIYRSTDDGLTWRNSADSVPNIFSFHDAGAGAVIAHGYRTLMRTTDDGITWSRPTDADTSLRDLFAILRDRDGAIVALDSHARSGSGVLRSTDAGATWSRIGEGIDIGPEGTYNGHAITPKGVHLVATSSGLWRNDGVSAVEPESASETASALLVVPHPIRDASRLTLQLARAADVTITLHDALGRTLRTLHSARLGAGPNVIAIDATGLSAGSYLLRASINGLTTTRTIVVE